MEYLHIKNLEKYQPQYKDGRRLLWIRWDIAALRDYKISRLSVTAKWLFVGLICLETETKAPVPYDVKWLVQQTGIEKKRIPKAIQMLQTLDLVVTSCNDNIESSSPTLHTDIHTDIQAEPTNISTFWDYFLLKTKKTYKLTPDKRELIAKRFKEGFTLEQLKKAVDNFVVDNWPGRADHLDLIYCIGRQKGKPDALEKWLNKSALDDFDRKYKKEAQ